LELSLSSGVSCSKVEKTPTSSNVTSNAPLPQPGWQAAAPIETRVVTLPERSYTSIELSVSALVSRSAVVNQTAVPTFEVALNEASKAPLPPAGPVEIRVVASWKRS
jgi:hypothetical protein